MFLVKDPEDFLLYMMQNQNNCKKEQNSSTVADNADVINSLSSGCYNPNISMNTLSSKGKSKSKVKKQKSQESLLRIKEVVSPKAAPDKNDKTLAILTNDSSRPVLNRFNSVYVHLIYFKTSFMRFISGKPHLNCINSLFFALR